ncbi:MAG: translation elongation factor Ts [Firmicutes bacterium]|nr:translation elongation factor Ts [Bacillota bacterium]
MDMSQIKKLREETGAGMLDCKKALESSSGDYALALKSLQTTTQKSEGNSRVASKGLCSVVINQNQAILFEVNAETDFVSKNEYFVQLIQDLGPLLIQSNVTNAKDALLLKMDDLTVGQKIQQTASIIKENAQLRRFYRVIKEDTQGFGSYVHQGGKVVTLVILDQNNSQIANALAMQVTANSPLYIDPKTIDEDTINYEKFMFEKAHGALDENQFNQHLNEICLLTQDYIKNPEIKVSDLLKENKISLIDFFRFELGQGIENKLNCKLDIPCDGSSITVTPIY